MTFDPNATYLGQPSFLAPPLFGFAVMREGDWWGAYLTMNGYAIGVLYPVHPGPGEAADQAFCSLQKLEASRERKSR